MVIEIRKLSKKGALDFSLSGLFLLLLGIAVLVVILISVTGSWTAVFSKLGLLPDNVEAKAQICANTQGFDLNYYCAQLDEVRLNSLKQRVTCKYLEGFVKTLESRDCSKYPEGVIAQIASDTCINLKLSKAYKINGRTCEAWSLLGGGICSNQLDCSDLNSKAKGGATSTDADAAELCKANPDVCSWDEKLLKCTNKLGCQNLTSVTACSSNPNVCRLGA